MVAIQEALPVALRRIGLLIAAVSPEEAVHPCVQEGDLRSTVVDELADIEEVLLLIQREAETAAETLRPHRAPEATQ
jgi:hypothetical protein